MQRDGETAGQDGGRPGEPAREVAPGLETTCAGSSLGDADSKTIADPGPSGFYSVLAPSEESGELGRLGPYGILGLLGTGGMGAVFRAVDPRLRRPVALKILKPELARDPVARRRFLREARAAAALEHDHVVAIYEVNEDRGVPYLVMPLLAGMSLEDRIKADGRLPIAEVLRIGREAAEGLAAAHARGMIHRDIKPANLWLEAGRGRVKILDFGLARGGEGEAADGDKTEVGLILGTPAFMAPEQANAGEIDARADLFSLGCTLYLMATGVSPFRRGSTLATLDALRLEAPKSPRQLRIEAPPAFSDLVLKLLEKAPADRPASAVVVAEALGRIEASSLAPSPSPSPSPRVRRRLRRIAVAAAFVGLVALAATVLIPRPPGGRPAVEVARPSPIALTGPGPSGEAHAPDLAGRDLRELHGAGLDAYEAWVGRMRTEGFRPVFVSAHDHDGGPQFAALAVRDIKALTWESRMDRDWQSYMQTFDSLGGKGFTLLSVCGYPQGRVAGFASIWVKQGNPPQWFSWIEMPLDQYHKKFERQLREGFLPGYLASYTQDGIPYLTSIFVRNRGESAVAREDLTEEGARKLLEEALTNGRCPVAATAYPVGGEVRFAVVAATEHPRVRWAVDLALTPAEYERELRTRAEGGMTPRVVSGYEKGGRTRYLVVWKAERAPLPSTGLAVRGQESFDREMLRFMAERGIRGGTLAVTRKGKLVLSRGYGFADRDETRPMAPETPMRLASVTKLFTKAAIRSLIRRGKLSAGTKVAPFLDIQPPPGKALDPRWAEITVEHLLEHRGGWDVSQAPDPMFEPAKVAEAVGKSGTPEARDFVTYMAGQPLQFAPGSRFSYSNFGYCLLGRVVEKASGRPYYDELRDEILAPLGLHNIKLGRTLPEDRDPREPCYRNSHSGPSVMGTGDAKIVPAPDGTFVLEAMDSHGGLVGSAPDLARFLAAYSPDGEPQAEARTAGGAFGLLPGSVTIALERPDGVTLAVLFNGLDRSDDRDLPELDVAMNRAVDSVTDWPPGDLPGPSPR